MAGTYHSWGACRVCGAEVFISRKYHGKDGGRLGYDCGVCWFRAVAAPMLDHARRSQTRIIKLILFPKRRRA